LGEWIYDIGKNEFQFSEEVANIFGIDKELKISYENLMRFVDDNDADRIREIIGGKIADDGDYSVEYTIKTDDGECETH